MRTEASGEKRPPWCQPAMFCASVWVEMTGAGEPAQDPSAHLLLRRGEIFRCERAGLVEMGGEHPVDHIAVEVDKCTSSHVFRACPPSPARLIVLLHPNGELDLCQHATACLAQTLRWGITEPIARTGGRRGGSTGSSGGIGRKVRSERVKRSQFLTREVRHPRRVIISIVGRWHISQRLRGIARCLPLLGILFISPGAVHCLG